MSIFYPTGVDLSGIASVFITVRFNRQEQGDDRFEVLPNVQCLRYGYTAGAVVPSAQFRYVLFNDDPSSEFPSAWEDLWPLDATGPYTVRQDDELIVYEYLPDGSSILVFGGFATLPQIDQSRGLEATFAATGGHIRLWDTPIYGPGYRDADDPQETSPDAIVEINAPVWFNPTIAGVMKPNKTPKGYDVNEGETDEDGNDISWPAFIDERLKRIPNATPTVPSFWHLGGFVRYLCQNHNVSEDPTGELWVENPISPNGATIDEYLQSPAPSGDNTGFMDLTDPSTYTLSPITIRSFDASNKALESALEEQLGYYNFRIFNNTQEDPNDPGAPLYQMILFRTDGLDGNAPKELFYPPEGSLLTDGIPSFSAAGIVRDLFDSANDFVIDTTPIGYEVSVVLGCGFPVNVSDASNVRSFDSSALTNPATTDAKRAAYRRFVFDECGLGWWNFEDEEMTTGDPPSLDDVFGAPETDEEGNEVRQYAHRFRPGDGPLYSKDDQGRARAVELEISRDYEGDSPGVWDGTGTWQSCGTSGWRPLKSQLGVELTNDNPESWKIARGTNASNAGDVVKVISSLANPSSFNKKFFLKYTCIIYGDLGLDVSASKRTASPTDFVITRVIDSKDHWIKQVIDKSSKFNTTGQDITARDDTKKAQSHLDELRLKSEFPSIAGSITVPWVEHGLGVGDLISRINGRDIDLQTNAGGPAGEGPRYPAVVGFEVNCTNPQGTVFKLSDRRAEQEGVNHGYGRSR